MIFGILYDLCIFLYLLILLPKLIYERVFLKKKRSKILQRFGFFLPEIKNNSKQLVVWIHGVSVGEIKAAKSLVEKLRKEYPSARIILSTTTDTGHAEAKRSCPTANDWIYFPIDLSFVVKRVIKKLCPDMIIFMESDLWINVAKTAKARGSQVALVSGKMSQRSANRFSKVPYFSKKLFSYFDVIGVQNEEYKERFLQAHAPIEKVQVTGNLKYDQTVEKLSSKELIKWKESFHISDADNVLTIASTHAPEEIELLSELIPLIQDKELNLKILIAPRHPERFDSVNTILSNISSENMLGELGVFSKKNTISPKSKIILIDTMGFLPTCFQLSKLVIMAGSYSSKIGGHNILEPILYDTPVIYGPHMHSQKAMHRLISESDSGKTVTKENLKKFVNDFLLHGDKSPMKMRKGISILQEQLKGSLEITWKRISSNTPN